MSGGESALDLAAKRLDRALALLEQRMAEPKPSADGGLFDAGDLTAELEKAKVRERELEAAGQEASAALGRAILEIRAALNGQAQEH